MNVTFVLWAVPCVRLIFQDSNLTLQLQSEVNELLALVYYDSIQNVVPSYDQRRHVPVHDASWIAACQNSFAHFEVAYSYKYVSLDSHLSFKCEFEQEKFDAVFPSRKGM